jgi:hypothetical protein
MKTAVREQVNRMDAVAYFTLLCKLMKDNPPAAADAPQLAKFASISIVPGQDFDASTAPSGDFVLMLRLYWPDESDPSIIDGSWRIPPVKKV